MFTVKFIPLKINKFTHYSKIIMCNLKLSWMILDLLLQNNLSTMEYIRIIQKVSKYHTNDQHWSRKIPYPTIYWRLPLFNKCLNTSYDFSQRVSITNYFPKIICKLFNFGWLSIFKILNKQTKWGEKSISLAGIPANKNSTSWKKARSPQKQSPQTGMAVVYCANHRGLKKGGAFSPGWVSRGDTLNKSFTEGHLHC